MFLKGVPQFGQPAAHRGGDRRDPGRDGGGSGNDRVPESPVAARHTRQRAARRGNFPQVHRHQRPGRTADLLADWAAPIAKSTRIGHRADRVWERSRIQRQQHPECGIGWTTLAGIAAVESKHGRHRGARIAADGDTSPHIRGVALDGTRGNLKITDTDGGRLDGDATTTGRWVRFSSSPRPGSATASTRTATEGEPRQPRRRGAVGGPLPVRFRARGHDHPGRLGARGPRLQQLPAVRARRPRPRERLLDQREVLTTRTIRSAALTGPRPCRCPATGVVNQAFGHPAPVRRACRHLVHR